MAKISPRVIPGLVTQVNENLRIVNGNIESIRRRRPGRPKRSGLQLTIVSESNLPGAMDLSDSSVRNGFHIVRQWSRRQRITKRNRSLQAKFDELCSDIKVLDPFSWEHAEAFDRMNSGKISRIEKSVPYSFCSCSDNHGWETWDNVNSEAIEEDMSCLVHGLKRTNCDCGGISGITGYRTCAGHRETGHITGVSPFMTERMKESARIADQHAKKIGWL